MTPAREPSPSAGWRETAVAMHAPDAHAVEPPGEPADGHACTALDCTAEQELRRVVDDGGRDRVLCSRHARDFLGRNPPADQDCNLADSEVTVSI